MPSKKPNTREDAGALGLRTYFGVPCRKGHSGERDLSGHCVTCTAEYRKRYNADRAEEQRAYSAEYYQRNRAKRRKQQRAWAKANPEKLRTIALRWRNENLEQAREYASAWYAVPENRKKANGRRQKLLATAAGTHTKADRARIIQKQKYKCVYCKANLREVSRILDHIMPLKALGGSNGPRNLQYLCSVCGGRKGSKHPLAFGREMGLKNPPRGQTNKQFIRAEAKRKSK